MLGVRDGGNRRKRFLYAGEELRVAIDRYDDLRRDNGLAFYRSDGVRQVAEALIAVGADDDGHSVVFRPRLRGEFLRHWMLAARNLERDDAGWARDRLEAGTVLATAC
jgi:hypothetical protein